MLRVITIQSGYKIFWRNRFCWRGSVVVWDSHISCWLPFNNSAVPWGNGSLGALVPPQWGIAQSTATPLTILLVCLSPFTKAFLPPGDNTSAKMNGCCVYKVRAVQTQSYKNRMILEFVTDSMDKQCFVLCGATVFITARDLRSPSLSKRDLYSCAWRLKVGPISCPQTSLTNF